VDSVSRVDSRGWDVVSDEQELRVLLGEPTARVAGKDRRRLHALDRAWIAASPFCLVATSAADGTCDVSPKGDPPGFDVEQVFFHCAKAFLRSGLWDPSTWGAAGAADLPSRARIAQALERPEDTVERLEEYYGPAYADRLYDPR
jgi:predicted pyridoxine 5'-phosphate oxidase superfamily flavin-nucleotide-binding protein